MKKTITSLLVFLFTVFCLFGFTACEDVLLDITTVTAEQWEEILGNAANFTLEITNGSIYKNTVQIDGDLRSEDDGTKNIYVKDAENYYLYTCRDGAWTKFTSDEQTYFRHTNKYTLIADCFKKDFELFKYANDVYTAAILNKEGFLGDLLSVKISFSAEKLQRIEFEAGYNTYVLHSVNQTKIQLPEKYDDKTVTPPLKDTEVTAEQWFEITANANNFTVLGYMNGNLMAIGKIDGSVRYQMVGENMFIETGTNNIVEIVTKDGETYYKYVNNNVGSANSRWIRSVITESQYANSDTLAGLITYFKTDYAAFTYENGAYTAVSIDKSGMLDGLIENVEFIFENKKLIYAGFDQNGIHYQIGDIGSTAIKLPDDFIEETDPTPSDAKVTAEQWSEILGNADNFTAEVYYGGSHIVTAKITYCIRAQIMEGGAQILIKDGENYYSYFHEGNDPWAKTEITAEDYANSDGIASFISIFKDDFNAFTYENGVYYAAAIDKTATLGIIENIGIIFNNGKIQSVKFIWDSTEYVITDVGSTDVEIPEV